MGGPRTKDAETTSLHSDWSEPGHMTHPQLLEAEKCGHLHIFRALRSSGVWLATGRKKTATSWVLERVFLPLLFSLLCPPEAETPLASSRMAPQLPMAGTKLQQGPAPLGAFPSSLLLFSTPRGEYC